MYNLKIVAILTLSVLFGTVFQAYGRIIFKEVETNKIVTVGGGKTNETLRILTNTITNNNLDITYDIQTNTVLTIKGDQTNMITQVVVMTNTNDVSQIPIPPLDGTRITYESSFSFLGGAVPWGVFSYFYLTQTNSVRNMLGSYVTPAVAVFSVAGSIFGAWWVGNWGDQTGELFEGPVVNGIKGFVAGAVPGAIGAILLINNNELDFTTKGTYALFTFIGCTVIGQTIGSVYGMNDTRKYNIKLYRKSAFLNFSGEKWAFAIPPVSIVPEIVNKEVNLSFYTEIIHGEF